MTRTTRARLAAFFVTLVAIAGLVAVVFVTPGPSDGITVTMQGTGLVGADVEFQVTVREHHLATSSGTYASLEGLAGAFETTLSEAQGHPWGRANVWNLTGLDLSYGKTFTLSVTPTWAGEIPLHAALWSTRLGYGAVRFVNGDAVDPATVSIDLLNRVTVSTAWPLTATATPEGPLVLGHPTTLRISVHESAGGRINASPLYLSVATKSMYYTLAGSGPSENAWNLTVLWNVTGADLGHGIEVTLSATPHLAAKGVGFDVLVWSPRGSLSAVQLDVDGTLLTPEAVRLWLDTTFSFPVASV